MLSNKELFDGIAIYVHVAQRGSFSRAAERLGHSNSFISKAVSKLEKRLGLRLLNRSTRSLSMTEAGKVYFDSCTKIVIDAQNAEHSLSELQQSPRGLLKISVPISFGLSYLHTFLPVFANQYPEIQLEIDLDEGYVDIVADGYDAVIRVGNLQSSELVARKIMSSCGVSVASAEYLFRKGSSGLGRP
ncbi:MAG: hypothetical protein COA42_17205 [Alteromonadaceae bacterium]|nr:MAG: hypothetical protein COA42_17205 [Alteromonadaceae bacterium]